MSTRHSQSQPLHPPSAPRTFFPVKRIRHMAALSQRTRGQQRDSSSEFAPPEDWHEPKGDRQGYRFVVQPPGRGYRHVVTPDEIRRRLALLPAAMLEPLEVIQLSRMTRKKQSFPCYGMQWGSTLYLYPIEESLTEYYGRPPTPPESIEARMYGGRWVEDGRDQWKLVWTEDAIKDFYLNNILIHELGHLLDERNSRTMDRERFAEWFAIEHGYRPTQAANPHRAPPTRRRRHHAV